MAWELKKTRRKLLNGIDVQQSRIILGHSATWDSVTVRELDFQYLIQTLLLGICGQQNRITLVHKTSLHCVIRMAREQNQTWNVLFTGFAEQLIRIT